jgi:chloramphenicol-sensitive protein RarD
MRDPKPLDRTGLLAAGACFVLWGAFPLFFDAMARQGATPWEIVGWRTVWSLPMAAALALFSDRFAGAAAILRQPRALAALALSASLIAVNWTVYIQAVASGRTLEASLGYYINPLVSLALGAVFFRERVSAAGWSGFVLAAIGVGIQAVALRALPWIPLALAVSFGSYGAVRKWAQADARTGLLIECVLLFFPAVIVLWLQHRTGHSHFGRAPGLTLLLFLAGPATVAPLVAFAFAARRLPLSVVGFMQFLTPTLQFCCGLLLGESLSAGSLAAFAFIWAGVAVFAWGAFFPRSSATRAAASEAGV